jgi:hypothetical protein
MPFCYIMKFYVVKDLSDNSDIEEIYTSGHYAQK